MFKIKKKQRLHKRISLLDSFGNSTSVLVHKVTTMSEFNKYFILRNSTLHEKCNIILCNQVFINTRFTAFYNLFNGISTPNELFNDET